MAVFRDYSALIEPLSLDEAFLDISDTHTTMEKAADTAEKIRSRVFHEIGLTCSAGVSFNKFLAKIGSDMNKPDGLTVISQEDAGDLLANLPIGKFFGVGKVTEKKMHNLGIRNGADLLRFTRQELEHYFGKAGLFFYDMVRGVDSRPVQSSRVRKSIGTETTLSTDIIDMKDINEILTVLSEKVEEGLRQKACCGSTVTLKVRYHDFTTVTRSSTLASPVANAAHIMAVIAELLKATDAGKTRIRLLGITVSNLCGTEGRQAQQLSLPF